MVVDCVQNLDTNRVLRYKVTVSGHPRWKALVILLKKCQLQREPWEQSKERQVTRVKEGTG